MKITRKRGEQCDNDGIDKRKTRGKREREREKRRENFVLGNEVKSQLSETRGSEIRKEGLTHKQS